MNRKNGTVPLTAAVLAAVNVIWFLVAELFGSTTSSEILIRFGALWSPGIAEKGQYWRFVTAMFLHSGIRHLGSNMITLCLLSVYLEPALGKARYLAVYLCGGLIGNLAEYALSLRKGASLLAMGASGAVFSVMGALLACVIRDRERFPGLGLRKMLVLCALSVYAGFASGGVANGAHVGGFLTGAALGALLLPKRTETTIEKEG